MRHVLALSLLAAALCAIRPASAQQPPTGTPEGRDLALRLTVGTEAESRDFQEKNPGRITLDLRRGLLDVANQLVAERRLVEALRAYELAGQVAVTIGDQRGLASVANGLGQLYGRRGDYPEAARHLREGLTIAESLNDSVYIQAALNNLGIVHRLQGEYDSALEYYSRALAIAEQEKLAASAARTLNNIGAIHLLRGSYQEALQYLQRSAALKQSSGLTTDLASTLTNIGGVHERMADFDLALEYYRKALSILGERSEAGTPIVVDLARVYRDLGQYDLAIEAAQTALATAEKAGLKAQASAALQQLADAHKSRGDLPRALEYYRRTLSLSESINDRKGAGEALTDIARIELRTGDPRAARDTAGRATRVAAETGSREDFWMARVAEGMSHETLGDAVEAAEAFGDAADIVEELRGDAPGGERERQRFFEGRLEPFQGLTRVLIGTGRIADALAAAERAKARVMLDVLSAGGADVRQTTIDERDRERRLAAESAAAHARLRLETAKASPDAAAVAKLRAAFGAARIAEAEFRANLYKTHPVLKLSRGDTEPGALRDAGAIVDDARDALLEFMVTPAATYLFVVVRGADGGRADGLRATSFTIPITEEDLSRRVERFQKQLDARDLDVQRTAGDLYKLLLAPAEAELRGRNNFIIVPDGPLWAVAFQALSPSPGHFLIERAAISQAPSIAVLREMRATRRSGASADQPTLLAFGDPAPAAAAAAGTGLALEPLPDARRQVERLRDLYGPRRSQIFVGEAATEDRFVAASATPTVLHIAAHGLLDAASPMYSFLALAGKAGGEAGGDGRLETWEIMKLKVRADVTVLAACETARGHVGAGEGVIGLSWAFFLAGSPRTVVSLWKVDAASTSDLMIAFHQQVRAALLRRGGYPQAAASLRAASLALLRDPRYRHPFYWAGFTVIGDGS